MMSLDSGRKRVGRLFAMVVLASAVASCNDSVSTGPSVDTTPPSVVSTDPAAGMVGVSRSGDVHVTFSTPIDPETVTGSSFTVTAAGSGVSGTASADGPVATWTPAAELASGTVYTATLSTAITDVAGNALASDVTWNFTTNTAPTIVTSTQVDATRQTSVTLDAGDSTDPDPGQTLTFAWTQASGTTVTLSGATSAAPTFTAPDEIGTLTFDLVVSDGTDEVTERVTVWVLENSASHYWVSPSGSDANAGTRTAPFASIQRALDVASAAGQFGDVYVAGGSYNGSLELRSGVSIYGGFHPATFLRDVAAHETEINGGEHAVRGFGLSGSTPVTLNGLTIRAADHTSSSEGSSIAIHLHNAPNTVVSNNRIFAGAGSDGTHGAHGSAGVAGGAGAFGVNSSTFCSDLAGGAGGSAASNRGGRGGNSDLTGARGGGSTLGGSGGVRGFPGSEGGHGHDGTTPPVGASGRDFGQFASNGSYVVASGSNGARGTNGGGGGGGGGGGNVFLACGGSGGGGGGGGEGGEGGRRGLGAGGSFGITVTGTSTNVAIVNNEITTGDGGRGGDGGFGGPPGAGGMGRTGGNGTGSSGAGGRGGWGGIGGRGAPGTGGGGGPSVGIAVANTAATNLTPSSLAGNTFTLGAAGSGGIDGNPNNPHNLRGWIGLRVEYVRR